MAKAKLKLEKQTTGWRLVSTQVLGWVRRRAKGWGWRRADGIAGVSSTQRGARRALEATEQEARQLQLIAAAKGRGKKVAKAKAPKAKAPKAKAPKVKAPAPSAARLELTAANLYREAAKLPPSARFGPHAFLGPLLARFGTTPQAVRAKLTAMHQNDEIILSRADLVDAMDPQVVRASEIDGPANQRWHLLSPLD